MGGRRSGLICALLMTAALLCALPGLLAPGSFGDGNRMDERLRPARLRTLTVWLMPGEVDDRRLLNELCAAFEKERPGVRVFLRSVTEEDWTAPDAVAPDVALFATGSLTNPERLLKPLAGLGDNERASGRSGGTAYAVPLWLEANVLALPREWAAAGENAAPTPTPLFAAATPQPGAFADGLLPVDGLPWRRLLEPGSLALPQGVALQQLLLACPAQLRGELAALESGRAAQARVYTLREYQTAADGDAQLTACLLPPAVSDRVRYAALGREGEDASAFLLWLMQAAQQARAAAAGLVPALCTEGGEDALTCAAIARFAEGMSLPNAFSHTAEERRSLCEDAFRRAADPVETLLRLR